MSGQPNVDSPRLRTIVEETGAALDYTPTDYRFGIEIEYFMGFKVDQESETMSLIQIVGPLVDQFNQEYKSTDGYVEMRAVDDYDYKTAHRTDIWKVMNEYALDTSEASGQRKIDCEYYPAELISPIFLYSNHRKWRKSLESVLKFFSNNTHLGLDRTCGLHIHVSPVGPPGNKWELNQLKRISRAVLRFDSVLPQYYGPRDKNNVKNYCRSNKTGNPALKDKQSKEESQLITDCKTIDDLIYVINARSLETEDPYDKRNYAFNFTPMSDNQDICPRPKYTVEFRGPRSTTEERLIMTWIMFLVSFLHGSVAGLDCTYLDVDPTTGGLNRFLKKNPPPGTDRTFYYGILKG